jgi:hypothetical protein
MSNDTPDGPKAKPWLIEEPQPGTRPDARTQPWAELGPQGALLTVAQRSSLLRAARMKLLDLHDQCEAIHQQGDQAERLSIALKEISTLEEAIAWLWRFTIAP